MNSRISNRLLLIAIVWACGWMPQTAQAEDLSGWWTGHWESCTTGHRGPLRGHFCRQADGSYQVRFSGRFFKIVPFRYTTTLDVVSEGDTVVLSGDSYLGRLMGTFHYRATASGGHFQASYSSRKDHGLFVLQRQ